MIDNESRCVPGQSPPDCNSQDRLTNRIRNTVKGFQLTCCLLDNIGVFQDVEGSLEMLSGRSLSLY